MPKRKSPIQPVSDLAEAQPAYVLHEAPQSPVLPGIVEGFKDYAPPLKDTDDANPPRRTKASGQVSNAVPQTNLSDEFEKSLDMLFKTLFKESLFGSVRKMSTEEKAEAKKTLSIVNQQVKGFYFPPRPNTVSFYFDNASLEVTQKSITFFQGSQNARNTEGFTIEAAKTMALLASQNRKMRESGVRLTGTEEHQKILRQAIMDVNNFLPEGNKLRIIDAEATAPQNIFTSNPQPIATKDMGSAIFTPVMQPGTTSEAKGGVTPAEVPPGGKLAPLVLSNQIQEPASDTPTATAKADTVSAAPEKPAKGILGRLASAWRGKSKGADAGDAPRDGQSVAPPSTAMLARVQARASVTTPKPV